MNFEKVFKHINPINFHLSARERKIKVFLTFPVFVAKRRCRVINLKLVVDFFNKVLLLNGQLPLPSEPEKSNRSPFKGIQRIDLLLRYTRQPRQKWRSVILRVKFTPMARTARVVFPSGFSLQYWEITYITFTAYNVSRFSFVERRAALHLLRFFPFLFSPLKKYVLFFIPIHFLFPFI